MNEHVNNPEQRNKLPLADLALGYTVGYADREPNPETHQRHGQPHLNKRLTPPEDNEWLFAASEHHDE